MSSLIISFLAICGLMFLIKTADGPFRLIMHLRNLLMRIPFCGVFFYELFSCSYCTGCWAAAAIFFLTQQTFNIGFFVVWVLAGAATSLIFQGLIDWLHHE
jgi:hypothetical protein